MPPPTSSSSGCMVERDREMGETSHMNQKDERKFWEKAKKLHKISACLCVSVCVRERRMGRLGNDGNGK